MAVNLQGRPSRRQSFYGDIKTTSATTVYTCPPNCRAEISFIHIVNAGGNNSVTIKWYIAADTYESNFLTGKNFSTGEYLTFQDIDLILEAGDQIRATTSSADHFDIILTAVETFVPVG